MAKLIYSAIASLDGYIGKRAFADGVREELELLDERRFASGSSSSATGSDEFVAPSRS